MTEQTKELHEKDVKEFYVVSAFGGVTKYSIPEKYRKDFEAEYTGGDHGTNYKDTAEYINLIADDVDASLVIMDYQIDEFIEDLKYAKDNEAEELE